MGELAPLLCVGLWRSVVFGERRSRSEKLEPKLAELRLDSIGGGGGGVFVRALLLPCVGEDVGRGEGVLRAGVEGGAAEPARGRALAVTSAVRGDAIIV